MMIDTLLHTRWLIPLQPDHPTAVLEHHSLAMHDGRIVALLPTEQATACFQATQTVDLTQHAVLPGLINAHTHAPMNLLRGLADDLPLMEWLEHHIWPTEAQWVGHEFVRVGTQAAIAEMLRGGITCFNDMYFFPDVTAQVAQEIGMRASIGLIVIDFPSAWAHDAADYLAKGIALYQRYQHDPLIRTVWAPHAPYTVSAKHLARIGQLAQDGDQPIHIHLHETAAEVSQYQQQHGQRPLAALDALGLLSPRLLAVHATQLLDAEIARLAETGAHVLHCPESNLKLASGFCPVAKLQAAGVNVALGTDGAASNNDLDMFGEMRMAALTGKATACDARALPAHRVLQMATGCGAKALGLSDVISSLEIGKSADVIAVNLSALETEPLYNPLSQLVYATSRQQVTDVWIAGRRMLDNRRLTTLDESELVAQIRAWRQRIRP